MLSARFNKSEQADDIDGKIKAAVKKVMKKKVRIHIEGGVRRPPMLKTPNVDQLWQRVKKIADQLDIRLIEEHRWSSADISFIHNSAAIDGMGLVGTDAVRKEEFILRHSLLDRSLLMAMVINDINK